MSQPALALLKRLHSLPVSADALRLLIALIAQGGLEADVQASPLTLGRACFSHEPESLQDQALRKRVRRLVQQLEQQQLLQVTEVKVGNGHGAHHYRVRLDATAGEREHTEAVPKSQQSKVERLRPSFSFFPPKKRIAPAHLVPKREE